MTNELRCSEVPPRAHNRAKLPAGTNRSVVNGNAHLQLDVKIDTKDLERLAMRSAETKYIHALLRRIERYLIGHTPQVQPFLALHHTVEHALIGHATIETFAAIEVVRVNHLFEAALVDRPPRVFKVSVPNTRAQQSPLKIMFSKLLPLDC